MTQIKKEEYGIVLEHKSKELIESLRKEIINNFKQVWVFHFYNTVSHRRFLKVQTVWDGDLPKETFDNIKMFSEKFLIDYKF